MGLLGAHVSISGGLEKAFERGESLGCEAIQIFSKNQRQWRSPHLDEQTIAVFQDAFSKSSVQCVVVHNSYLINLANPDPAELRKSREAFLDEMIRAHQLNSEALVFHPGSHKGDGEKEGIKRIAESLNQSITEGPEGITLLLETTAGQGFSIGGKFEHLAEILSLVRSPERLGVCLDTAHIHGAGYPFRSESDVDETFDIFDRIIGLKKIRAFHLNDSKVPAGSKKDRHENIGEGEIGTEIFRKLIRDQRFQDIPMILETPGGDDYFRKNLDLLKSFRLE